MIEAGAVTLGRLHVAKGYLNQDALRANIFKPFLAFEDEHHEQGKQGVGSVEED